MIPVQINNRISERCSAPTCESRLSGKIQPACKYPLQTYCLTLKAFIALPCANLSAAQKYDDENQIEVIRVSSSRPRRGKSSLVRRFPMPHGKRVHRTSEENSNFSFGEHETLKLTHHPNGDSGNKVEIWYAPSMNYLPVKTRITQQNGDFSEQRLSAITKQ